MVKQNKGKLIEDIFAITKSKPDTIVNGKSLIDKLSDMTVENLIKLLKVCNAL